ncbi:MAG: hypothetical protein WA843_04085, partial [Candidatus Saccharimonadales bacterium]
MAETAATLQFEPIVDQEMGMPYAPLRLAEEPQSYGAAESCPALHLVQEPVPQTENESPASKLINVDAIPELHFTRRRAATKAKSILNNNQQLVSDGKTENVPLPVDALGTAKKVIAVRKEFGEDSPEYRERFNGLLLDCERQAGEASRKLGYELFRKTEQQFDPKTGDYFADKESITVMLENGLSPFVSAEEQVVRVGNFVEEDTYRTIGRIGTSKVVELCLEQIEQQHLESEAQIAKPQLEVRTIQPCTNEALEEYRRNPKGTFGGYVPEIDKFMLRSVCFAESGDRFESQIALSGTYITPEVIRSVVVERGGLDEDETLSRAEWHGKEFIDLSGEGEIRFVAALDTKASEVSGKPIFMGEVVEADHPKDYSVIEAEAETRRRKLI